MIRRAAIVLAALAALLVAGCGGSGSSSDQLASVVPPEVPAYAEMVVRPEGEQRDAIDSLASRVGGIDDLGAVLIRQVDAQLAESGISYEADIAPWLGDREALFFQSFEGDPAPFAAVLETTDPEAAQKFLDKLTAQLGDYATRATYQGVDYFLVKGEGGDVGLGVVDGFLVGGTLGAFKAAVDASNGSSLADSSAFTSATSAVPDDNLGLGYVDGKQAGDALSSLPTDPLQATAVRSALQTFADGPVTFAVTATPDSASVEVSLPTRMAAQLNGGDLVGQSPADSWLSVGLQNVGGVLGDVLGAAQALHISAIEDRMKSLTGVDPQDALSWMNNGHGFVGGTSEETIAIGGVVGSSDPEASAKSIDAFHKRFQQDADADLGPPPKGADHGFSATAPESPQAIQIGQFGDQVAAALGPGQPAEEALDPKQPLSGDPTFHDGVDALGSEFSPLAFLRLAPFFVVAEKGGSASDPDYVTAKPYLQKLDYLMVGTSGDGDRSTARFVVGVK